MHDNALTILDLFDILRRVDEVTLLENLHINSDLIVDRFPDKIEEHFDKLCEEYGEDEGQATLDWEGSD